MVPLENLVALKQEASPQVISHYNLFRDAEIDGSAAPGRSSGDAIIAMDNLATKTLPPGFAYEWTGLSLEEIQSGSQAIVLFGLGILVVYLTLAAQYESFSLPFIVLLAVPTALLGAIGAQALRGQDNDVYCQIGLVMLVGLLGKNAILIVEFAVQRHHEGVSLKEAAIEGGKLRFRPILMTSFAFIAGLIPLVAASGPGAIGNRTIGGTAVGGMLLGTIIGVLVIPGLYYLFARLDGDRKLLPHTTDEPLSGTVEQHATIEHHS
jgi:HAE1 family hydrophobic/amphiphilic exporter-1